MKGKHIIRVRNKKVHFTVDLERNITVIRGDSATGKTTLIGMLTDYETLGAQSGVSVECDKTCRVLNSIDWETRLSAIHDSIVFIDEGNAFVHSADFARAIQGTDNYYVLITRESLYQLPYSVESVLELRKTTSRINRTYNRTYPYYKKYEKAEESLVKIDKIITEDSNAGHQMFTHIAARHDKECVSAQGKSKIFRTLQNMGEGKVLVIADGAAFGAEMEKVYQYVKQNPDKIDLYLPESFEWLVLKSGMIREVDVDAILAAPENHIDSEIFFSWEQFFTDLLMRITADRDYMRYNKQELKPFYLQDGNVEKLLAAMEE